MERRNYVPNLYTQYAGNIRYYGMVARYPNQKNKQGRAATGRTPCKL